MFFSVQRYHQEPASACLPRVCPSDLSASACRTRLPLQHASSSRDRRRAAPPSLYHSLLLLPCPISGFQLSHKRSLITPRFPGQEGNWFEKRARASIRGNRCEWQVCRMQAGNARRGDGASAGIKTLGKENLYLARARISECESTSISQFSASFIGIRRSIARMLRESFCFGSAHLAKIVVGSHAKR